MDEVDDRLHALPPRVQRPEPGPGLVPELVGQAEAARQHVRDVAVGQRHDRRLGQAGHDQVVRRVALEVPRPERMREPGAEAERVGEAESTAFPGRLLPLLTASAPARVVILSSGGHAASDIHWDDPNFERGEFTKMDAYGQSKTANALFARELATRTLRGASRRTTCHNAANTCTAMVVMNT